MPLSTNRKPLRKNDRGLYKNRNTPYFSTGQTDESNYSSPVVKEKVYNNLSLQDEWVAISYNLTDEDREFLLRGARLIAERNILLRSIRESDDRPALYQSSSRNISLPDFIKSEWFDKGWKPSDFERSVIQEYDPKLLKAVTDYENKRCELLPDALRFKKNRNRVSRAELVSERSKPSSFNYPVAPK